MPSARRPPNRKPEDGSAATYPDLGRILTSLQSVVSQLGQSVLNNNTSPPEAALDLDNSASSGQAISGGERAGAGGDRDMAAQPRSEGYGQGAAAVQRSAGA